MQKIISTLFLIASPSLPLLPVFWKEEKKTQIPSGTYREWNIINPFIRWKETNDNVNEDREVNDRILDGGGRGMKEGRGRIIGRSTDWTSAGSANGSMGDALRIAGMMEWRTMATWRLSERLKRLERLEPSQFSHLKPLKGNKEGNGEKKERKREKEKKRKSLFIILRLFGLNSYKKCCRSGHYEWRNINGPHCPVVQKNTCQFQCVCVCVCV